MTLDLILIRHGESVANLSPENISGLSADTPLTKRGEMQARKLGEYLRKQDITFDTAYVSPTVRTKRTASLICQAIGIRNIIYTEKLYELSRGDWVGKVRTSMYTPEVKKLIEKDPLNFKPPNGESSRDLENRAHDFLATDLQYWIRQGRIALIGHAYQFKCLLRVIMGFDPRFTWKIQLDNTSMTGLLHDENGWHLKYLNATPHLR